MKTAAAFVVVLVTAPDTDAARRLAQAVLQGRVAACANLVPGLESHYWWQGKLETSSEVLLILKTTRRQLAALEKTILAHHPYDTPEILALPLAQGTPKYLHWLAGEVRKEKSGHSSRTSRRASRDSSPGPAGE
ncbi:MAG: divalent-cation tolerance protein CutA [Verrucomicrobiae bacterium]|nr:divalent-cation tolerance protein CutA [Verrucomicrobiae bacterium]